VAEEEAEEVLTCLEAAAEEPEDIEIHMHQKLLVVAVQQKLHYN
jgi:hypothetical protein